MNTRYPLLVTRCLRAFTMVETMVAVGLLGLVSVGIVTFFSQGLKVYYVDRAKLMINRDIRSFTQMLDTDAVTANYFILYQDFNTRTTTKEDGEVGDFLVLVYTDPSTTSFGISMVTRVVGYYREVTNATLNYGPVHRFDVTLATAVDAKTTALTTILTNNVTAGISTYPVVTQLAQGLATNASGTTPTPALFYNYKNHSVMIDTQISESLTEKGVTSQTGNTYNFSVSPRG